MVTPIFDNYNTLSDDIKILNRFRQFYISLEVYIIADSYIHINDSIFYKTIFSNVHDRQIIKYF